MGVSESGGHEVIRGQIWRHGAPVDGFALTKISDCIDQPDTLVWADLDCPTHTTLTALADELDIGPYAIEDIIAASERVKMVAYQHYSFMTVYAVTPYDSDAVVNATPLAASTSHSPYSQRANSFRQQRISVSTLR